jgi:calpain-7
MRASVPSSIDVADTKLKINVDLEETDDRLVTIVNPWRHSLSNREPIDSLASLSIGSDGSDKPELFSDTWRLSWEDICNTFDGIYLSWNPQIFQHVIVHHRYNSHRYFVF